LASCKWGGGLAFLFALGLKVCFSAGAPEEGLQRMAAGSNSGNNGSDSRLKYLKESPDSVGEGRENQESEPASRKRSADPTEDVGPSSAQNRGTSKSPTTSDWAALREFRTGPSQSEVAGPSQAPQVAPEEQAPPTSPPIEVAFDWVSYQNSQIKNRLAAFTSNRLRDSDTIDAIILYKNDIIDRMAQLDPNPFWAEQKNQLIADGILNYKAEYTIEALERNLSKLNDRDGARFFRKLLKSRETFESNGRFY